MYKGESSEGELSRLIQSCFTSVGRWEVGEGERQGRKEPGWAGGPLPQVTSGFQWPASGSCTVGVAAPC